MHRGLRQLGIAAALTIGLGVGVAACGDEEEPAPATSGGSKSAASGEVKKVSFMLDYFHSETHSAFFAADEQGFYKEEGLEVDIQPGQGSTVTAQQVGEGNATFGWANATAVTQAVTKGAPIKAIASMRQLTDAGVMYWPNKGISSPADLAGKTCGVTAAGFVSLLFPEWAKNTGADESKIKTRVVDASAGSALFGSQKIDCFEGSVAQVFFYKPVDGATPQIFRFSDAGLNTLGFTLIASHDTLSSDADTAEKFVRATLKGWKYACANAEEVVPKTREHMEEPAYDEATGVKILLAACELEHTPASQGKPLGYMAPEDWTSTLEILQSSPKLEVKDPPPAEDLYTNDIMDKVGDVG